AQSNSLKLQYRNVETMSSATRYVTMATLTRIQRVSSSPWSRMTTEHATAAPAGIGSPMKYRLSVLPVMTLKRASRSAPQITKRNAANHAGRPRSRSANQYSMNAGATPNETMSASESYSTPNWLVAFMSRATRPSSMSMIMATKIASVAGA